MVSFIQAQCMNCGAVEDLPRMAGQNNHDGWCSQCGFTRSGFTQQLQTAQRPADPSATQLQDDELIAMFSRNLFLSQPQQQQQQAAPRQEQQIQQAQPAARPVNFSISQHYHHYTPIPPPTQAPAQPTQPTEPITPPPTSPMLLEQLHQKAATLRAEAYQDYHRQLQKMEEQYNLQQQAEQQLQNPGLIGSPVSTTASIHDDVQLQMALLEQERQNHELQQQEEQLIFQQLMASSDPYTGMPTGLNQPFIQQQSDGSWSGGQPVPPPQKDPADPAFRTAEDFNTFYNGSAGDSEMVDDEESPCVLYHSRNYRMQYHFI